MNTISKVARKFTKRSCILVIRTVACLSRLSALAFWQVSNCSTVNNFTKYMLKFWSVDPIACKTCDLERTKTNSSTLVVPFIVWYAYKGVGHSLRSLPSISVWIILSNYSPFLVTPPFGEKSRSYVSYSTLKGLRYILRYISMLNDDAPSGKVVTVRSSKTWRAVVPLHYLFPCPRNTSINDSYPEKITGVSPKSSYQP